jgi:hypothetical protein
MVHGLKDFSYGIAIVSCEATVIVPINIQAASIAVPMDVQGSTIAIPVDIQGQTVMIDVNIKAQTIETLKVDIVAQTVGNIGIDIKAQSVANLKMDIIAQTISDLKILAPSLKAVHIGGVKTRVAKVSTTITKGTSSTLINISGKGRFIGLLVFLSTTSTTTFIEWEDIFLNIIPDNVYVISDRLPLIDKYAGGLNSERLQSKAAGTYTFEPIADSIFNVLCVQHNGTSAFDPTATTEWFYMEIREIGFMFKTDIEFENSLLIYIQNNSLDYDLNCNAYIVYGLYP